MIRVRTWFTAMTFAAGLAATACNRSPSNPGESSGSAKPATEVDIGQPLYAGAKMPPAPVVTPAPEPIVIPNAVVQNDQRVQIAAQVDGQIDLLATPLPAGAKFDPKDPNIVFHPRDPQNPKQPYRRLRENDIVREGQILGRLDEQLVTLAIQTNHNLVEANKRAIQENREAAAAYVKQLDAVNTTTGAVSLFEKYGLEATVARLKAEVIQVEREMVKAEGDKQTAQAQLARYWIISKINGKVVKLLKSPGEFVKAGDAVLEVQATDRVRVEGRVDVQYANLIMRGMKVAVEPARPVGPLPLANYHRQEVTSIAVTAHPKRPMIVSGGLDETALVWDATGTKQSHRLPHPPGVGVRAVAATGPQSKNGHTIATGGADGKVRLWDVTNPDKLPSEPAAVLEDAHVSAVTCAAFSPDGRFLATAANREVFVWDAIARKKLYVLPGEHRDAITSLRFTPQATLVTVSRDRAIRVWKVGDQAAVLATVIDHRGGAVDVLGVSSDGSKMLFDKGPNRLDVVSLADQRSIGTLQTPGTGARFATLALFSADDSLILAAGTDAELTVWETPKPGSRGAERVRLLTPNGAAVTCAAFSPDSGKRILAVGTAEGGVYIWTPEVESERARPVTGEVVAVLPADARTVQVRVEVVNPTDDSGEGLQDRSLATIVIYPGDGPPPVPAAPRVASTVPAGVIVPAAATEKVPGLVVQASEKALPVPFVPTLPPDVLTVPAASTPPDAGVKFAPNPK